MQTAELAEELWDKYSELIGDDIFSLERFASTIVITRSQFMKAMEDMETYANAAKLQAAGEAWDMAVLRCTYGAGEIIDMETGDISVIPNKQQYLQSLTQPIK